MSQTEVYCSLEEEELSRPSLIALLLLGLITVLAVYGTAQMLPWLIAENRRLEPWKWPLVWSSELAGTVVFLQYPMSFILPSWALRRPTSRLTFKAFCLAICVDLTFSAYEALAERGAYARAIPVQSSVAEGRSFVQRTGHRRYSFTCKFVDHTGSNRVAWFSLLARELPLQVCGKIDDGKLPAALALHYDPAWPARCWVDGSTFTDNNRVYVYSILSVVFSALISANLVSLRKICGFASLPPPEVGPFIGATFLFCTVAALQGW
jgi:hypothetical protein